MTEKQVTDMTERVAALEASNYAVHNQIMDMLDKMYNEMRDISDRLHTDRKDDNALHNDITRDLATAHERISATEKDIAKVDSKIDRNLKVVGSIALACLTAFVGTILKTFIFKS
jgi:hypothetical protein